jgi:antitoxin MazE
MVTRVQKWGNSQGLRFSKELLNEAQIGVGDEVSVSVRGGKIIVEAVTKVRGKYKLEDLISEMPKSQTKELDWGPRAGKEVW